MSEMIFKLIQDADIIGNWVVGYPHNSLIVGKKLKIIPYEFIFRYYLTGSFWRDFYQLKNENPWGVILRDGLQKNIGFDEPIFTPTRKSVDDPPISEEQILLEGILTSEQLGQIKEIGFAIGDLIFQKAKQVGMVFVDFKL